MRALKQVDEARREPFGSRGLEEVDIVFEMAGEHVSALFERNRQVILCRPSLHLNRSGFQTRQAHRPTRRILEHKHHLENGSVTGGALRLEFLHELLKWHILVIKGVKSRTANPLK